MHNENINKEPKNDFFNQIAEEGLGNLSEKEIDESVGKINRFAINHRTPKQQFQTARRLLLIAASLIPFAFLIWNHNHKKTEAPSVVETTIDTVQKSSPKKVLSGTDENFAGTHSSVDSVLYQKRIRFEITKDDQNETYQVTYLSSIDTTLPYLEKDHTKTVLTQLLNDNLKTKDYKGKSFLYEIIVSTEGKPMKITAVGTRDFLIDKCVFGLLKNEKKVWDTTQMDKSQKLYIQLRF